MKSILLLYPVLDLFVCSPLLKPGHIHIFEREFNSDILASVLSISRANAYTLMHSKGFPTIRIGKRMVVHRDKLIDWMNARVYL